MRITQKEILDFAAWSGDRNPIHVNEEEAKRSAFGGTIVHGALSTVAALREAADVQQAIAALDIEFRGEIRPDRDYDVAISTAEDSLTAIVRDGSNIQLSIRADLADLSKNHPSAPA